MSEKLVVDATKKTVDTARRGLESFVSKAWSIMDAVSEKRRPTEYLGQRAVSSIQGKT